MIKFFRKIRRDLLSEGKVGKYFKYAIGEIILVVIGILIALQINSWNQNKQNTNLELEYLKGICNNLENDLNELENLFKSDSTRLNAYTLLVKNFNSGIAKSQKIDVIKSYYVVGSDIWFEGQNVVFVDMQSSGKFSLIQSDSIKYAIQNYYRFFDEVIKQEDIYNAQIRICKDRNFQFFNISSFLEPSFPKQWNGESGPPDMSFVEKPNFNEIKYRMINNLSLMKLYQFTNHNVRLELYQKAKSLKDNIEVYLIDKK